MYRIILPSSHAATMKDTLDTFIFKNTTCNKEFKARKDSIRSQYI